jgi:hypothetical protein
MSGDMMLDTEAARQFTLRRHSALRAKGFVARNMLLTYSALADDDFLVGLGLCPRLADGIYLWSR